MSGKKFIGQNSNGEDVGLLGDLGNFLRVWPREHFVAWLLDHFGRHILRGAGETV